MKIKKNIGKVDRKIRIIIGILMIIGAISLSSIVRWFLFFGGVMLILTALIGFCGLYVFFDINTCKFDKKKV